MLADDDRSIQVHSCHGSARQVEVLREVLLGLLADDATLEPRDILVMCPDIETYAPLFVASFGLGDMTPGAHPAHSLRIRLADRALTQTNQLLGVAAQLLTLAGGRATASAVLNVAQAPPVRTQFGFTDDDLDAITDWVRESGVRWGLDQIEPRTLRPGRIRPQHVAFRYRPGAGRRRDVRGFAGLGRHHTSTGRRGQQPRRIGGQAGGIRATADLGARGAHRHPAACAVAGHAARRGRSSWRA